MAWIPVQEMLYLQLLPGCSSNSSSAETEQMIWIVTPGFSPPTQKADLAGMFTGGTQQQSREMEGEKGFWPIANSCVFFSASSNRRPSDGGAIPSEKVYRGSHSASYPASLAPISHPLPSNYCSFHLTSTPKTLSLQLHHPSSWQTGSSSRLSHDWSLCSL